MINILSLGAGVQSSTLALMATKGIVAPMPSAAIFADTGQEPNAVYEWLEWLTPQLAFPVIRVEKGDLRQDSLVVKKSGKSGRMYLKTIIPAFVKNKETGGIGLLGRRCTRDYKLDPIFRKAREIAGVKRGQKHVSVVQWIGISVDEAHRMKPSRELWAECRWPLIEMNFSRQDCLRWMKAQGFPEPPRSACVFCPFHSDFEWQKLKETEPVAFQGAVEFERNLQEAASRDEVMNGVPWLTRRCVPLDTIDFSENAPGYQQISMFGNECEGLCGV